MRSRETFPFAPPLRIAERGTGGEAGFALLAAMWLLVAVSAIGLALSLESRSRRLGAANLLETTRARAAAQAGVEQLRARLAARIARAAPGTDPWLRVDSLVADTVALGDARYAVRARDAGAALNLNRATEDDLRRLFVALRVDAGDADRLAQAILDWRDPDDLHRGRGAERAAYLEAGAAVLPRNAPFQTLSELLAVRGMTPELYERVRPHLTLLGTGQVNLNAAGRPVLLALPGMTEQAVAVLERLRAQGRSLASVTDLARELPRTARATFEARLPELLARTTLDTREVEAVSEGWTDGGHVQARLTALLVRSRNAMFFVWSRME